jgi:hypothetical protein
MAEITIIGLKELNQAIKRNPQVVLEKSKQLITRAMAEVLRITDNNPWRVGMSGGGTPVAIINGGNLRQNKKVLKTALEGRIKYEAGYASYVHDGTSRMKARPWLDYAKQQSDGKIQELSRAFLKEISQDLAK